MQKPFLIAMGIGTAVVAAIIGFVFYLQWGAHIEVKGQVLKVRTAPLDEHSSVAVLDFRFANPADYLFQVRNVTVVLVGAGGGETEGSTIAGPDSKRLFDGVPLLGQKYNEPLIAMDAIKAQQSADRMVAARFEVPVATLDARKRFLVRVEEVNGPVSEISEK